MLPRNSQHFHSAGVLAPLRGATCWIVDRRSSRCFDLRLLSDNPSGCFFRDTLHFPLQQTGGEILFCGGHTTKMPRLTALPCGVPPRSSQRD